jgi:hypothetical protein
MYVKIFVRCLQYQGSELRCAILPCGSYEKDPSHSVGHIGGFRLEIVVATFKVAVTTTRSNCIKTDVSNSSPFTQKIDLTLIFQNISHWKE